MVARLDTSHREDKKGMDVQVTNLTGAGGTTIAMDDIVSGQMNNTQSNPQYYTYTVAALGTNFATGAPVVPGVVVVTAADGTKAVSLPTLSATTLGQNVTIFNNSASILKVFPDGAAAINAGGAGAALSMAANTSCEIYAVSTTQWYTSPRVPS